MPLDEVTFVGIEEAAKLIKGSRYVIALTGAGVSVESGIRPFRGPGGLWTEYGEPSMDGYRRFEQDPKRHWEDMISPDRKSRFSDDLNKAKPNLGHYAFAELEAIGVIRTLITQNIDNLHSEAGSQRVLEIHGNRLKLRCIECGTRFQKIGFDLSTLPPHCPECGGIVKEDVVMFGEPIPRDVLAECQADAEKSDCIIVTGTSAIVFPAASLPLIIKERDGAIIEVNPFENELSKISDVVVRAPSGEALPALVKTLKRLS